MSLKSVDVRQRTAARSGASRSGAMIIVPGTSSVRSVLRPSLRVCSVKASAMSLLAAGRPRFSVDTSRGSRSGRPQTSGASGSVARWRSRSLASSPWTKSAQAMPRSARPLVSLLSASSAPAASWSEAASDRRASDRVSCRLRRSICRIVMGRASVPFGLQRVTSLCRIADFCSIGVCTPSCSCLIA